MKFSRNFTDVCENVKVRWEFGNPEKFQKIVSNRPEKSKKIRTEKQWNKLEKDEFNFLTASIREKLGYEEIK